MKKFILILFLALISFSCKSQYPNFFWSYPQQNYTTIHYGALYNWYAATDSRKITSSDDWVIGNITQWESLSSYLGGETVAGGKLKEIGFTHWSSPNTGATNESLFNARGSGFRTNTGFSSLNGVSRYWTSSKVGGSSTTASASTRLLNTNDDFVTNLYNGDSNYTGNPIRLLYTGAGTPTEYVGNDGKRYPVVLIGSQCWISMNLAETKFRNGDWITGFDGGTYTPISNATWAASTSAMMCVYNNNISNL